ncbi:MAG: SLBB domain-containing protein [Armatimonadetes bacterium]|nr:SLBB domain-containing protein [Armatimonadota bacterium]
MAPLAHADQTAQLQDVVVVHCQSESRLNGRYRVLSNGSINIPSLGQIVVVTRSSGLIQSLIQDKIADVYGIRDQVVVSVVADRSSAVTITGAVKKELLLTPPTKMTAKELLSLVEVTDSGDASAASVTDAEGHSVPLTSMVRPGDRIRVPVQAARAEIFVIGGVEKPGSFRFYDGMSLKAAVESAGGVGPRGDSKRVFIIRSVQMGPFDLSKDGEVKVQRGDSIRVEAKAEVQYVAVTGLVRKPTNVVWSDKLTAKDAIKQAGGVANPNCFVVVRSLVKINKPEVKVRWRDFDKDKNKDIPLEPGDIVDVVEK